MVHDDDGHDGEPAACATTASRPSPTRRTPKSSSPTRYDTIGPLGAKSQGECAINPVAPAVANALANATGVRFAHLPFTPDRIFADLGARQMSRTAAGSVTIVTQTRVRPAATDAFARWQGETSAAVAELPGLHRAAVMPPNPPLQVDWVILQRFASLEDAQSLAALDRAAEADRRRRSRCWSGATTSTSCATTRRASLPAPVSAVITTRVKPGKEAEYRAWEQQDRRRPVEGDRAFRAIGSSRRCRACRTTSSPSCGSTARPICRRWMNSPERLALLEEAEPLTEEFHARIVRTGFEQWFKVADGAPQPAAWKMNMIVLLLLYPVVFLFGALVGTPFLMPGKGLPFWLALFIGNIVSVTAAQLAGAVVCRIPRVVARAQGPVGCADQSDRREHRDRNLCRVPPRVRLVLGLSATPELIRGGRRLSGKAMFQIMGVFAEFERAMIRKRVLAGLARVKEQGVSLGRRRL